MLKCGTYDDSNDDMVIDYQVTEIGINMKIDIGDGEMAEREDRVNIFKGADNGGRRKHDDRRQFSYTIHIPERRTGTDRRKAHDRRHSARHEQND